MRAVSRRAGALGCLVVIQAALLNAIAILAAEAAPAYRHGWWSQAALAPGVTVRPPDVPPGGLYVEASPSGPLALAAVEIDVGRTLRVDSLVLGVVGTPVITAPPLACELTSDFVPADGGAWEDKPSYNCSSAITGVLDADRKRVAFDVRQVSHDGLVRLAILAGGEADRVALQPPDDAGVLTSPLPSSAGTVTPVPEPSRVPSGVGTQQPGALWQGAVPGPVVPLPGTQTPTPQVAPLVAASTPTLVPTVSSTPTPRTHRLAVGAGLALLLLCLCYWADGFGAVPLRRRLARADVAAVAGSSAPRRPLPPTEAAADA